MPRDSLFLNNDDERKPEKERIAGQSGTDNVTPEQALNAIVQEAASEFGRVTGRGNLTAKLNLYDDESMAMMRIKKYDLEDIGMFSGEISRERVLECFNLLNEVLPAMSILRQMMFMSNSLHDDHHELFIPRLNAALEAAVEARSVVLKLMDRLNELSISLIHKHNYDNPIEIELNDDEYPEEDGSEGDTPHDGIIQ